MAINFSNDIDNYANNATGTITLSDGSSVDYVVTRIGGQDTTYDGGNALVAQDYANNNATFQTYYSSKTTVTYSQTLTSIVIRQTEANVGENYFIEINGTIVDLNNPPAGMIVETSGVTIHPDGSTGGTNGFIKISGVDITTVAAVGDGSGAGADLFDLGTDTADTTLVPCFAGDAKIRTEHGDVAVRDLKVGDKVVTFDGGVEPIRWIGSRSLDSIDLRMNPKLRPVVIRANALGEGHPAEDLTVSPQHRILIRSTIARRMFGTNEVLVPAIKLIGIEGIELSPESGAGVDYYHILFDKHQIVYSNEAWTESLYIGPWAIKSMSQDAREEIVTIFPELCKPGFEAEMARHVPEKGSKIAQMVERHASNGKSLYL